MKYVARQSIPLQFRVMVVTSDLHQPSFSNSLFTLSFLSKPDLNLDLNNKYFVNNLFFFLLSIYICLFIFFIWPILFYGVCMCYCKSVSLEAFHHIRYCRETLVVTVIYQPTIISFNTVKERNEFEQWAGGLKHKFWYTKIIFWSQQVI